jgi:sterol desaturase/sphingolipid hydroxylase (fatty acid hydroxylase superfamily)
VDLTVVAIPYYFGTMGAEHLYLKHQAKDRPPTAGDYTREDTLASLAMGAGSLVAPLLAKKLLDPVTPGKGRFGKVVVATAVSAAVVTTIADVLARREEQGGLPEAGTIPTTGTETGDETDRSPTAPAPGNRSVRRSRFRKVAGSAAVTALATGALAASTAWAARTSGKRIFANSDRDLGTGALATVGAVLGWDFIYYWNHRLMHTSRWMWAIHVAHHSSEHYNLSTALRQTVMDSAGMFVPYGLLSAAGFRPESIETARGVNLLFQYWIHTETIPKLGRFEEVFNTASHHRVHHGSNRQYLDRNHGSIFIIWDRLFGTFEREDEPVVYGLTKNIDTFNPARIATHEFVDLFRDVASSDSWSERLNFAFRGPGWAYERHRQGAGAPHPQAEEAAPSAPMGAALEATPIG